ncbi:MAG: T9SS type A sorting domain-containing protein [Ignavibacteriaceae bacterium]|nr:T9SS type A sorting domain-containing protein [Ignavibacteriaceae bacterium]
MRVTIFLSAVAILLIFISFTNSEPSFNGSAPGCAGSSCHVSEAGIVSAEVLDNLQVRITVSGSTSKVAGELVDGGGNVVAVINSTSSNPFILTAPSAGTYTVNAGFKSPSFKWGTTSAIINVSGIDEELIGSNPNTFELYSNYPNPFNPSTKIRYAIPQTSFTVLKVYDITGTEVMTLVNEERPAGIYEVNFDAVDLASGTYIYQLQAGNYSEAKKMILLR